jgi:two-component system sensor histidine kinase EvgS
VTLGHRNRVASDGREGFEAWQQEPFDLVIADCNMPVMNGYELARAIRRQEQQNRRPRCTILGFTANAQPEEIQRCKEAGMDDCLFKPLSLSALSQWVDGIKTCPGVLPFSLNGLHLLTGGNPNLNRRLLTELLNSNRLDLQSLLDMTHPQDNQQLLDMAHKIKGAARIVQAAQVIDSCEALEAACHGKQTGSSVADCTMALERALSELEHALLQQIEQNTESRMTEP